MADASVVAVLRAALDTQADVREHAEKQIGETVHAVL